MKGDFILNLLQRNPIDLVVEVDSLKNISHHHMVMTPQSPVSSIQKFPLYSPVKRSPCSPLKDSPCSLVKDSPCSPSVSPQSEGRSAQEEESSPWSAEQVKDQGIESQKGR